MRRAIRIPLLVGVLALVLTFVEVAVDPRRAVVAYFSAFAFAISSALGALIFLMITITAHARWFVVLRRTTEAVAATLPILALAFVPIAFSLRALYPWARGGEGLDPEVQRILIHERPWLNEPFFLIRAAIYFAIWITLSQLIRRESIANDEDPSPAHVHRLRTAAAAGLPIMGITLTSAAFDWFMSLNAGWTSDMFGVYFFAGGFAAAVGLTAVIAFAAYRANLIPKEVSAAHFHALGRVLLVTVIFWTYISYAQLLLVWIADLPREVSFYVARRQGVWAGFDYALLFGHFVVPFFALLSRPLKRRPAALALVGAWLVVAHGIDMYWLVTPAEYRSAFVLDLAPIVAVVALAVAFGAWRFFAAPPYPKNDPDLAQSLRYESP